VTLLFLIFTRPWYFQDRDSLNRSTRHHHHRVVVIHVGCDALCRCSLCCQNAKEEARYQQQAKNTPFTTTTLFEDDDDDDDTAREEAELWEKSATRTRL